MIGRYEAYMNETALSAIDNSIVITDINYKAAKIQRKTNKVYNRVGSRIVKTNVETNSVSISFMIRELDTIKRQQICQKIAQWALQDGYLRTSDKPWQRLKCVCEEPPIIESTLQWTDTVTITFTAYNPPYWEEINPTTVTLGGTNGATSGSANVFVPGDARDTLVSATITAKASVSSFSVTANGKTFSLSGLSLSSGDVVTIDYDSDLNLRIRNGSTSLMNKRSAASADDLTVDCGKSNSFSFTSSATAVVVFRVRGWWI